MTAPFDSDPLIRPRRKSQLHSKTTWSRRFVDRAARWSVTVGGIAIIGSILGILFFIVGETWPLLKGAEVEARSPIALEARGPAAVLVDEHRTALITLGNDGTLRTIPLDASGAPAVLPAQGMPPVAFRHVAMQQNGKAFVADTVDGRGVIVPISFVVRFDADVRKVVARAEECVVAALDPAQRPLRIATGAVGEDGRAALAGQREDGTLALALRSVEANALTGESTASWETVTRKVTPMLTALVVDAELRNLYGGAGDGELLWWKISAEGQLDAEPQRAGGGAAAVTALGLLLGDASLLVGRADGAISVWFPVRVNGKARELTHIRDFPAQGAAIRCFAPSRRDKGFLALDTNGGLGLYHSTAERVLWRGESPIAGASSVLFAPKGDAAYVVGDGRAAALAIDNPHPEVSGTTLFGKVWYEGDDAPKYVWQSTGGTDDFEPKLSLVPLLMGTLKGTVYSLLLAIPLAVLAAMYTSQFVHEKVRRYVKPIVEIMAALPSVVLGFLAGLWLAPRVEQHFAALLLMLILLPVSVLAAGAAWSFVPRSVRGRLPAGIELIPFAAALATAIALALALGRPFEQTAFGTSIQTWFLEHWGVKYDQRNAIVVGLAMGFAVIPIIFAIAEDAFSNVPTTLISASLALGATRWQTVTRVVLPTASPGIFSGVMVGFGRAVGETMIVLMATGNTPILDWSPFNGFRSLSANIATEIPEAAQGSTHYRALFLAALLLFALTFVANTAAELIRQRLRRKYASL